jgi:hypothetical protein
MGNGSGAGRLSSRIFTNSFPGKNYQVYRPYDIRQIGNSFYGLSKPQYASQTYHQLASLGTGMGDRSSRWDRATNAQPIQFVHPNQL